MEDQTLVISSKIMQCNSFLKSKKIESETIRYTVSWEKNKLGKREKLSLLRKIF